MDPEEYRKKVEKEVLQIIEERLKLRQMDADRAREISRYIVNTLHPHITIDQIHEIVQKFDDHFPELIPVVVQVSNDYDERIKKVVATKSFETK